MKNFLTLFLLILLSATTGFSQSTTDLEKQLKEATSSKEKMLLNNQLGEAYLRSDADKALDYAKEANRLAVQLKNSGMSSRTAYLLGLVYERKRNDRNAEVWFTSATKFAKQAGDSDLIIKSVDKRSKLATKDRNYRKAYQINQEAFTYFSKNGSSISDLESKYEMQKTQLEREKKNLEKEKQTLQSEIGGLVDEKNQLSTDKQRLTARQRQLVKEKEKVEQAITEKEEALITISEEKEIAEENNRQKDQWIQELTSEMMADSMVLMKSELALADAQKIAEQEKMLRTYVGIGAAFVVVLALFFYSLYRSSRRAKRSLEDKNKIIEEERERSDELLHNILPVSVAKELKEFGKAKARKYSEVTVLFSDFKNFTRISEQLGPEELVQELDKCFKAFDFIISQHEDIEKIKTIGDAYMCVSGLSERRQIPYNIIRAAMEMQEFLEEQKQERQRIGKPFFEARIGIHTGPVVAGVVGVNKFAYDIWGDTVNIAARMESKSETGRVNISESTYNKVRYKFDCTYRGKVDAKNKGRIDMYFVNKEIEAVAV